jgi:hypothetical protein
MPRLSRETWADIRAEREAGASFGELAQKYGVDKSAIFQRSKKENWSDGSDVQHAIRRKVNRMHHVVNWRYAVPLFVRGEQNGNRKKTQAKTGP